jgi:hypothetical protein
MKRLIVGILALMLCLLSIPPVAVQAAAETESHLIVGKFEYWYSPSQNTFWADFNLNGTTTRVNLGRVPFQTYEPWFPTALVTDVTTQYKYMVKSVEIAQDSEITTLNYTEDPLEPLSLIKKYCFRNFVLTNPEAIIGQAGTTVNFKAKFQIPGPGDLNASGTQLVYSYRDSVTGTQMFRAYIPIKVVFEKVPAAASLSVSGVIDPNPAELTPDGYAYPDLIVTAKASGVPDDYHPAYWILQYRMEGSEEWITERIEGGNMLSESKLWKIRINKDTKIYLHAEVHYEEGTTITGFTVL